MFVYPYYPPIIIDNITSYGSYYTSSSPYKCNVSIINNYTYLFIKCVSLEDLCIYLLYYTLHYFTLVSN